MPPSPSQVAGGVPKPEERLRQLPALDHEFVERLLDVRVPRRRRPRPLVARRWGRLPQQLPDERAAHPSRAVDHRVGVSRSWRPGVQVEHRDGTLRPAAGSRSPGRLGRAAKPAPARAGPGGVVSTKITSASSASPSIWLSSSKRIVLQPAAASAPRRPGRRPRARRATAEASARAPPTARSTRARRRSGGWPCAPRAARRGTSRSASCPVPGGPCSSRPRRRCRPAARSRSACPRTRSSGSRRARARRRGRMICSRPIFGSSWKRIVRRRCP